MAKSSPFSTRAPLVLLSATAGLLLAGCAGDPQTIFNPKGEVARDLMNLHILIGWLSLVVMVGVTALLLTAVIRFRRSRMGTEIPPQWHGNTRLEIVWSLVPVLVLIVLAVPTLQLINKSSEPPESRGTPLPVTVVGHQWWWEFIYPSLNITTADELHIPVGQPIELTLRSKDVIHSFWVPALGGKTDVIPTRENRMWFIADEPGTFPGQCMEFCGLQHAMMRHWAIAQPPAEFDAWVKANQQPAAAPQGAEAQRGAQLFIQKGCGGCHTINGLERAAGQIGPNLTHLASRNTIVAGTRERNDENLRAWLRDPHSLKPGNDMGNCPPPNGTNPCYPPLSDDELNAVIAYLNGLK